jgi:hypothetical protein
MADLNEPKEETERIGLPAPAGVKPPTGSVRPPPPPSVAPRPLLSKEEVAAGPGRPTRPTTHPSAPAASGAARPPNGPPPPIGAKASVPPPPPSGLIPPSPSPVALSLGASGSSKPDLSPINRPLENRDLLQAGPRQETARVADAPLKAAVKPGGVQRGSVPLAPIIRAASPVVANSPAKGLGAIAPAQLCWALLGISVLTLLMQLWNYFS